MSRIFIFCGIPFSGKTTIAKMLAKKYGYERVDLDEVKFKIFGRNIIDKNINQNGWDRIYKAMYKEIEDKLYVGKTVIHDTGNFTMVERSLVIKIAKKMDVEYFIVFINTPIKVARKRLIENKKDKKRFDISLGDFNHAVKEMETPKGSDVITYRYPQEIDKWIKLNFK